jgi:hypothetical protein
VHIDDDRTGPDGRQRSAKPLPVISDPQVRRHGYGLACDRQCETGLGLDIDADQGAGTELGP